MVLHMKKGTLIDKRLNYEHEHRFASFIICCVTPRIMVILPDGIFGNVESILLVKVTYHHAQKLEHHALST